MMGGNPARCQYPRGKGRATHCRTAEEVGRPATETELPARETIAKNTNRHTEGLGISSE